MKRLYQTVDKDLNCRYSSVGLIHLGVSVSEYSHAPYSDHIIHVVPQVVDVVVREDESWSGLK